MNLKALQKATDKILDDLQKERDDFPYEAINWADLYCFRAEYCIDQDCNGVYRVYIEEASPNCPKLASIVSERLKMLGFYDIEVVTEW